MRQCCQVGRMGVPLDPSSPNSVLKAMRTESNLAEDEKKVRQLFVYEYLKDFNASKAVLRMGFQIKSFAKKGSEFLREPYVQQLIDEHLDNAKEDTIVQRSRIMAGLLAEATNAPEAATRVAAWTQLGKISGMYIERKEVKVQGSGVMILPSTGTPDEWEAAASAAQAQLKEAVADQHRNDSAP